MSPRTVLEGTPRNIRTPQVVSFYGWVCTQDPKARVTAEWLRAVKRMKKFGGRLRLVYVGPPIGEER